MNLRGRHGLDFFFLTFPILILPASNDKGSDPWGFFVHAPCQDFQLLLPQLFASNIDYVFQFGAEESETGWSGDSNT